MEKETDETGIDLEYLASMKELEELTLPFTVLGEVGDSVLITGIALTEGVWKNVIYSAAEIEKYAKSLKGKPVLVEHGNTKEFGNNPVGIVESSYFEPNLKGIVFKAKITDPMAKRLIKKDILPAVSCSTWMEKKAINDIIRIGTQYQFSELSLVRIPACDRCFIFHKEQLSALTKGEEKSLKVTEEELNVRDEITMSPEETETLSEIDEEEEELMNIEELEAPKLYAILELPDEESLVSLRNAKRVVSYYYGYPQYSPYYEYPQYRYPYTYRYPYKYPYSYKEKKSVEEPVLLVAIELDSKEELAELRETYRIRKCYYGYYPKKLGEQLSVLNRTVGEPVKPIKEEAPKSNEPESGPLMVNQIGAPNPEQCQKATCPVCDKEFPDEKSFLEHWEKEHKEAYGDFKETMTILDALSRVVDLSKGDTKIVKTKTGRFVLFVDTGKTGFGQWKISGNFATEKEAKDAAAKVGKAKEEKAAEEEKDEHGCIVGQEEWSEDDKKCVPISKEEQSAYTDFIAKCRKEGKSMKECAVEWHKEEQSAYTDFMKKCMVNKKDIQDVTERMKFCAAEYKKGKGEKMQEEVICPACKEKFPDEKALAKHWQEKHIENYGPLKKGYKYPEKKAAPYYYYKYKGNYYPYYYQKGKYYTKYGKPKKK